MSTVTVRRANLSDLDDHCRRCSIGIRQFQGLESDLPAARKLSSSNYFSIHGESAIFIAHSKAAPVEFAQPYPEPPSPVSLARVFVLNDLFVQEFARPAVGVASKLFVVVEGLAPSLGAVRIPSNVARDNERGQALYAARGWCQDRQFHMYHRYPGVQREA